MDLRGAMVILVGAVIIGGIKSIGNFAGRVVPFMCVAYMLVCLTILMMNASQIPNAVVEIFVVRSLQTDCMEAFWE